MSPAAAKPRSQAHGTDAHRKLNDHLMSQAHKKEEVWMKRYGKALEPKVPELPNIAGAQGGMPARAAQRTRRSPSPPGAAALPGSKGTKLKLPADAAAVQGLDGGVEQPSSSAQSPAAVSPRSRLPQLQASPRGQPPPVSLEQALASVPRNAAKPLKELELELQVLKAVKAREDALDKLRVVVDKVDKAAQRKPLGASGASSSVLSAGDTLVMMLHRLVATLRSRTLDVVEASAAWQRRVQGVTPFYYYGVDYVMNIGSDLAFLDRSACLQHRLAERSAAADPFLTHVTPDGVPIDENVTAADAGKAGGNAEGLRIRMARKILAAQGHPAFADNASYGRGSFRSSTSSSRLAVEPTKSMAQLPAAQTSTTPAAPAAAAPAQAPQAAATTQQAMPASPPLKLEPLKLEPLASQQPAQPGAGTVWPTLADAVPAAPTEPTPQPLPAPTPAADAHASVSIPTSITPTVVADGAEDVDYVLDTLLTSLERPPTSDASFTLDGYEMREIDRLIDELVKDIEQLGGSSS